MKIVTLMLCATLTCSTPFVFANQPNEITTATSNVTNTMIQAISLNEATAKQLTSLKGIGEKKALAIISYREANGKFTSMNDLLNVKGIGEKVLADNIQRLKI